MSNGLTKPDVATRHSHLHRCSGRGQGLDPKDACPIATKIIERLQGAGYSTYIVGGGVRDMLLGRKPKDFDIATEAWPKQIRQLFPRSRLIGRRFKLAHIYSGNTTTEVATFRRGISKSDDIRNKQAHSVAASGRIIRDNVYGSIEEDALRRDFTINSMYYDPCSDELVCHEQALDDIRDRKLRLIGEPVDRYREDPVRMLRALRFSAKLGLNFEESCKAAIISQRKLLHDVSAARLFDEVIKLFHSGGAEKSYELLRTYKLFEILFPMTAVSLKDKKAGKGYDRFLHKMFANTDTRIANDLPVTPAFVISGLWWLPVQHKWQQVIAEGAPSHDGLVWAIRDVVAQQNRRITVPIRFRAAARDILTMLPQFEKSRKKSIYRILQHPRFRAAYDMFCLLARSELADTDTCTWWTEVQTLDSEAQREMINRRVGHNRKMKRA